jgi:hypothetical protein
LLVVAAVTMPPIWSINLTLSGLFEANYPNAVDDIRLRNTFG